MKKDSPSSVSGVVNDLILHYSQPIHGRLLNDLPSPILDQTVQQIPPVVGALLDRLTRLDDDACPTILQLFEAYYSQIRQNLFTSQNRLLIDGISTLEHYVMLVRAYLSDHSHAVISLEPADASTILSTTLHSLASDLTLVTVASEDERNADDESIERKSCLRKRRLIPALIMASMQTLKCAAQCDLSLDKDCLRNCYVSLLAFKHGTIDPRDIDPTIEKKVCHLADYLLVPSRKSSDKDLILSSSMPWSEIQLDSNQWMDESCSTLLNDCWEALGNALGLEKDMTNSGESISIVRLRAFILEALGVAETAKILRSHFFGRNLYSQMLATGSFELHLGHRIYVPAQESSQKPYERVPSRVFATLHFLAYLPELIQPILDDLLPILYELLSAANDTLIALGCAFLYRLCAVSQGYEQTLFWPLDNFWNALGEISKTCRVGPTIILTGLAQRSVLSLASITGGGHHQQLCSTVHQSRLQATQRLLLILDDNCHRVPGDDKNHVIWGLIVTLIPDFYYHKDKNAGAVQVGRVALRCFLTMLTNISLTLHEQCDDGYTMYVFLVLHALSNLLVIAHPIMKHHAGKLLTTLVGVSLHFQNNNSKVTQLVEHVGGMVLLVCQESHHLQPTLERLRSGDFKDDSTREVVATILSNFQVAGDQLRQGSGSKLEQSALETQPIGLTG